MLLTELSRSVWENVDHGHVYRLNVVRSVLTTSFKVEGRLLECPKVAKVPQTVN